MTIITFLKYGLTLLLMTLLLPAAEYLLATVPHTWQSAFAHSVTSHTIALTLHNLAAIYVSPNESWQGQLAQGLFSQATFGMTDVLMGLVLWLSCYAWISSWFALPGLLKASPMMSVYKGGMKKALKKNGSNKNGQYEVTHYG